MNGFSTNKFLKFTTRGAGDFLAKGLLTLKDAESKFPYYLIKKDIEGSAHKFLITPICFSGGHKIDFEAELLSGELGNMDVSGGFIQSRKVGEEKGSLLRKGDLYIYIDTRTNYRIPLNIDDTEYLNILKRDSRTRLKKIIQGKNSYCIKRYVKESEILSKFSAMYDQTSKRLGFGRSYKFNKTDWESLLKSRFWDLYVLYQNEDIIAGCIIATIETGYDYTFMAYDKETPDAPRSLIYFLRSYLKTDSSIFLDLGGGIEDNDSLATFKISMGGFKTPFQRCRYGKTKLFRNIDSAYNMLNQRWP